MFFKVIGKFDNVDEYGRHFINIFHIKENDSAVTTKNGQIAIKFSAKNKALSENLSPDAKVYHCSTYDWDYKGKKGTTYFCFKIQEVNDYYEEVEIYKKKKTF
jgi:hypothetical protein